jgi:pimeloyl-ACP methyl ester carboxylesterase
LSNADRPVPAPARDYAGAERAFAVLCARDGPEISSPGRSRFYAHGRRTSLGVVLIHGLTNAPQQWDMFSQQLHAAGHTVVVPRLPGHGHFNRATRAPAHHGGTDLLACVSEAVDIACGAAERVVLAGLSIGGTIAPNIALARDDVAHTIAIVPFFTPARLDVPKARVLARALDLAPNFFVPWDPGGDGSQIPSYGYPKFASRMLAACLCIGFEVDATSFERAPAGRTTFLLNAHEPACNNEVSRQVCERFEERRAQSAGAVILDGLPANHDIIDPTNPHARVDLVYPVLRGLIEGTA